MKRKIISMLLCVAMLFTIVGCGQTSVETSDDASEDLAEDEKASAIDDEKTSGEEQVVRMWTFLDPEADNGRSKALKQMIENFETENPDIKIVVEAQDWTELTPKFLAAHSAGNAPDIIWSIFDDFASVMAVDALEPLEDLFLDEWTEEEIADIDDAFFNYGTRDGKHYQITHSRNYQGLFYRKDLLEEKGLDVPKTWDEFIVTCQALTEIDPETGLQRYGFGQVFNTKDADPQIMTARLLESQGDLFTKDGKANWANEAGAEALQFELDCVTKYGITPETAFSISAEDIWTEFSAGRYAFINSAVVRMATVRSQVTFDPSDVGFMLYPSEDGQSNAPGTLNGWCVGVWNGSQVKEAAGKFVEAMMSPESDELWVTLGGQLAIRKSTIEKLSDFYAEPDNEYLVIAAEGIVHAAYPQPTDFIANAWQDDLNQAAQLAYGGGMSVEDALTKAADDFNERNGR